MSSDILILLYLAKGSVIRSRISLADERKGARPLSPGNHAPAAAPLKQTPLFTYSETDHRAVRRLPSRSTRCAKMSP